MLIISSEHASETDPIKYVPKDVQPGGKYKVLNPCNFERVSFVRSSPWGKKKKKFSYKF